MSEYWKSTPTYWCKFCETYVRDTPLSKQQHEATGKHQGAIQRSLRKLHKDHQNEEREKQRAKDEVARLKGLVNGKAPSGGSGISVAKPTPARAAPERQATQQERFQQMKQLAAMGIAVPDEFRKDLAMASEWQTVSVKPLADENDGKESSVDSKSFGVRKRKQEDDEDLEGETASTDAPTVRKSWGSRMKTYKSTNDEEVDFDQLMSQSRAEPAVKKEEDEQADGIADVKKEHEDSVGPEVDDTTKDTKIAPFDEDPTPDAGPVVFKKRKAKVAKLR